MMPKWPKLASLAQKTCTLSFSSLVNSLLPKDYLFKNIFVTTLLLKSNVLEMS